MFSLPDAQMRILPNVDLVPSSFDSSKMNEYHLKEDHSQKEIIKIESVIDKWKWFVTPSADDTQWQFNLTPKSYKDLSVFCPTYQIKEHEFVLHSNQQNHDSETISKVIEFVKEKGRITGVGGEIFSYTENHQRSIGLYYHIPASERIRCGWSVQGIANIKLPYKKRQTVNVCIETLSRINEAFAVESTWSQETYNKMKNFVIYYINQIAIDNSEQSSFSFCSTMIDNRLYLAQKAKDKNEAKKYLFEKYNGPDYWLLHD